MRKILSTTPAVLIAAGALLLSATGGAVAGSMITGANIKDGTVTTADIKNFNLKLKDFAPATVAGLQGANGVSGYEVVHNSASVAVGLAGSVSATCPAGKKVFGIAGDFLNGYDGVQTVISATGDTGYVYGYNKTATGNTIRIQLVCASIT